MGDIAFSSDCCLNICKNDSNMVKINQMKFRLGEKIIFNNQ